MTYIYIPFSQNKIQLNSFNDVQLYIRPPCKKVRTHPWICMCDIALAWLCVFVHHDCGYEWVSECVCLQLTLLILANRTNRSKRTKSTDHTNQPTQTKATIRADFHINHTSLCKARLLFHQRKVIAIAQKACLRIEEVSVFNKCSLRNSST